MLRWCFARAPYESNSWEVEGPESSGLFNPQINPTVAHIRRKIPAHTGLFYLLAQYFRPKFLTQDVPILKR